MCTQRWRAGRKQESGTYVIEHETELGGVGWECPRLPDPTFSIKIIQRRKIYDY
jgi:hypothetical protein